MNCNEMYDTILRRNFIPFNMLVNCVQHTRWINPQYGDLRSRLSRASQLRMSTPSIVNSSCRNTSVDDHLESIRISSLGSSANRSHL
jgi:hypothetical protein